METIRRCRRPKTCCRKPISPYAVQKVAGEHYLASYTRVYGLETVALRYFNVFGPRQDPTSQYSGVLARFISLMLKGETPTIFGDGLTSRDFVYIDNVVSANLKAAKAPSAAAGRVFNVATGKRTTLLEAYEAMKAITGYAGGVDFKPEREGDIKHSLADISLAREVLGYEVIAEFRRGTGKDDRLVQGERAAGAGEPVAGLVLVWTKKKASRGLAAGRF